MINPAQFNDVLSKASDQQLMALLKRPDKIPSQFVVSEINRRQSMRQAAQAQQRQQAIMQEQQRAAQNMSAQMRGPRLQAPNNMGQPVGMQTGGPTRGIGDFNSFLEYKLYMDEEAEGRRQRDALRQAEAQSIEEMAGIATADAGMTDIDPGQQVLGAGEAAALDDSGMTNIDAGIRKPFFEFGGFNPGAAFSDGSPMDIGRAVAALAPDIKVGPVHLENAFSDGSPADIPKALAAGAQKVATTFAPNQTANVGGRNVQKRADVVIPEAVSVGARGDRSRRRSGIETVEAQNIAQDAALNKQYAGIRNFDYGPMTAPVGSLEADVSGAKNQSPDPGKSAFNKSLGNITIKDGKAEIESTGDAEADAALQAAGDASIADAQAALKGDNNSGVKGADAQGGTQTNTGSTTDTSGIKSVSEITDNRSNNKQSIGAFAEALVGSAGAEVDTSEKTGVFTSESLMKIFRANEDNIAIANDAANAARMKANDNERERIDSLKSTLNQLHDTQSKLLGLYDKTAMTPENRIFTAMIDAGLALAGSKEANFLQAVAEAGKTGVESFNNLNDEAKKNLFAKYSASVDLAKSRVNIESQLNQAISAVEQSEVAVLDNVAKQESEALSRTLNVAAQEAQLSAQERELAQKDKGLENQELGLQLQGIGIIVNGTAKERELQLSAERNAISAATADNQVWVQMRELENADERLDLAAQELGIKREQLTVDRLYKYINTKMEERRLDIAETQANKTPDSVAKMEWMLGHFGKDGLLKILGPSTTGAVTDDDIARMATSMATASSAAMDEVIGADGKVIEDPSMQDYVTYYTGMLKGIYQGGGGQASGSSRVFNEQTGKVE